MWTESEGDSGSHHHVTSLVSDQSEHRRGSGSSQRLKQSLAQLPKHDQTIRTFSREYTFFTIGEQTW